VVKEEPPRACTDVRPGLAEHTLGILEARERGGLLGHLDRCAECGLEAERLALVADLLVELAPSIEPPEPLEHLVVGRDRSGRVLRAWHALPRVAVAAAAAVLFGAIGLLAGHLVGPSRSSSNGRPAVGSAAGRSEETEAPPAVIAPAPTTLAALTGELRTTTGQLVGRIRLYDGRPPWLVVRLSGLKGSPFLTCRVVTRAGHVVRLGTFSTASGGWDSPVPVPATSVTAAEVTTPSGTLVARARLTR